MTRRGYPPRTRLPASAFTQRLDRLPRLKTRGVRSFAVTLERRQQAGTTRRSAADEVIAHAGFCVEPTIDALKTRLDAAMDGA